MYLGKQILITEGARFKESHYIQVTDSRWNNRSQYMTT